MDLVDSDKGTNLAKFCLAPHPKQFPFSALYLFGLTFSPSDHKLIRYFGLLGCVQSELAVIRLSKLHFTLIYNSTLTYKITLIYKTFLSASLVLSHNVKYFKFKLKS